MKTIISIHNPEIKELVQLQQVKYRKQQRKFIAEGWRTCSTLIDAGFNPIQLYVTEAKQQEALSISSHVTIVNDQVIKKISSATTPSGLVGIFPIPKEPLLYKLGQGVVLAQIQDPGNMGTLIRTAAALGLKSVVIIEGTDPWSPKVIQATAGTIAFVDIFECTWQELIKHKASIKLCALVVSDGNKPEELVFKDTLLVVGSEAHGLPQTWIDDCEMQLTLPMPGGTESLNAAVAGSIAMYLAFT